jgi:hypothetical protein
MGVAGGSSIKRAMERPGSTMPQRKVLGMKLPNTVAAMIATRAQRQRNDMPQGYDRSLTRGHRSTGGRRCRTDDSGRSVRSAQQRRQPQSQRCQRPLPSDRGVDDP